jgi:hypothetical protein
MAMGYNEGKPDAAFFSPPPLTEQLAQMLGVEHHRSQATKLVAKLVTTTQGSLRHHW